MGKEPLVLGIAGSPRRGGNTDILLDEVLEGAASRGARVKKVILAGLKIASCDHSDACLKTGKCYIKDDMQSIYQDLEEADVIVLASPIQFMTVTAELKTMIDRCQAFWARKYVLNQPPLGEKERKGLFIAVGGTKFAKLFEPAQATIKALFNTLNVTPAGELLFRGVDEKGAIRQHPEALKQAFEAGQKLVEG
ncbi:MAG: flavodoxin family protein [Chloroflexi bacterium]|nr:flavodoxin family protein [Chloroflexota bacterium]